MQREYSYNYIIQFVLNNFCLLEQERSLISRCNAFKNPPLNKTLVVNSTQCNQLSLQRYEQIRDCSLY